MDGINPRYANYARAHGNTPEQQLEADRIAWPGGVMTGYILWHKERIVEGSYAIPSAYYMGRITDHDAYDAWLTSWVDQHPYEVK